VILALDAESGYPHLLQLSSGYESLPGKKIDDQGGFRLMPLPPGNYRLLALSGLENDDRFLSEFYDGVHDFNQSPVISLNGNVVENIDFTLVPGQRCRDLSICLKASRQGRTRSTAFR
jgi:hypothetical protein